MARIRDQMDKIAESMVHLSDQSKLIGEIISAVDDLSQQSNLLSVNASIEAAKAREHGKGFAVVAQEVKNLSSQSKDATSHVRRVLSDIGKASTAATMATELGTKAVIAGQEVVFQARDSILTLSANVGQSAQASTQIEVLSQQQLIGMQQVVAAMESVRVASDQNVKSVGDLESALSKLLDLGRSLKELTATRVISDGDLTYEGTDKGLAKLWREVPQSRRHQ
jgi:methyl-accepting chemotaxis protein